MKEEKYKRECSELGLHKLYEVKLNIEKEQSLTSTRFKILSLPLFNIFGGNIYLINNVSYLSKRTENVRDFISFGTLKGTSNHTVSRNLIS